MLLITALLRAERGGQWRRGDAVSRKHLRGHNKVSKLSARWLMSGCRETT